MFKRKHVLLAAALSLAAIWSAVALTGCSNNNGNGFSNGFTPISNPGQNEVWIYQYSFRPETLKVASGTDVTFTNKDPVPHDIASGSPAHVDSTFDSGLLSQDMSFKFTFTQPGIFHYYCSEHPDSARGVIIVN